MMFALKFVRGHHDNGHEVACATLMIWDLYSTPMSQCKAAPEVHRRGPTLANEATVYIREKI